MATTHGGRTSGRLHFHRAHRSEGTSAPTTAGSTAVAASTRVGFSEASVATLRVLLGFVFLWAFLDKEFGLGYSTAHGSGWVDGGSPTKGFLAHVYTGPMASTLRGWAGAPWADWLFMLGLLGIGAALVLGIGLRVAAVSGTVLLALMWLAEWPPARHTSHGAATGSTNPFADYHVLYAAALIVFAAVATGSRLGLGAWWGRIPFVARNRWLR